MANMAKKEEPKHVMTLVSPAFEGDSPPAELSVGIVSLIELCQQAMPNANKVRGKLIEANFQQREEKRAQEITTVLAFDKGLVEGNIRNFRHAIYQRERHDAPVVLMVSEGDTGKGPVVMVSTLFTGAAEADVVKAVGHVTKAAPFTGQKVENKDGFTVRRVFWELPNTSGVRFMVASGPADPDAMDKMRAITAISKASK